MGQDRTQIALLIGSAALDQTAFGAHGHDLIRRGRRTLRPLVEAGLLQIQMHPLGCQRFGRRRGIQIPQHAVGSWQQFILAEDAEVVAAMVDLHAQSAFDLLQMLIELAAQVRQPLVVERLQ